MSILKRLFFLAVCLLGATSAFAQSDYPSRPIRIIVTYTPGGASDILARMVGEEMSKAWKQAVVVENRPGAGGAVGLEAAARSAPDGYTLVVGVSGTLVMGPHLMKGLTFDTRKDFTPVAMLSRVENIFVVDPNFEAKTIQDVIALAKAKPGALSYASGAAAFQLGMELFKSKAGIDIVAIPYKGDGPAALDVIAGRVPMMISSVGAQLGAVRSGKLRALAVLGNERVPSLPDVPTMMEAGVPGYVAVGWNALVAPAGVPAEIADKINREVNRILEMPDIRKKIIDQGFEPWPMSRAALADIIATEHAKWGEVVRAAGIEPQ
ncbi:Bug family tripartite tricarboxylate transporter substrate binding protein [Xanthobacter tagetidis]|uniref:Tripartite tricarboxylate transporter substrate binding protein n=1 Tax=Xanthobacter tagetidis TaxID=60216 RepID=A0A3L7A3X5_9HYPH|nr:tripartite tricarboxylate transporter substrate binding protein [Xanthobacter tagetidis]MBB6309936.1 tripartite-type tricarboxylate transporter receptor subunit TctC [Xanthobacter tagetidis]RLP74648.1 tripartite tricarboxylate transporter substrate binding protein [Xanthobacter tagetidis]